MRSSNLEPNTDRDCQDSLLGVCNTIVMVKAPSSGFSHLSNSKDGVVFVSCIPRINKEGRRSQPPFLSSKLLVVLTVSD